MDVLFDGQLHCLDDEVAAVRDANRIVVGEEVRGEFVAEGVGDVACDDAANCGGDTKRAEFGGVHGIFV